MSLLDLPPEILMRVMQYLDASFFREDVQRLAICKRWYACAQVVLLSHLELTPSTLNRLLSCEESQSALSLIKTHAKTVNFIVQEPKHWSTPFSQEHSEALLVPYDSKACLTAFLQWMVALDSNLTRFGTVIKDAPKVRSLRIQAWTDTFLRRDYISLEAMQALISLDRLTVLDMDTCGIDTSQIEELHPIHLCQHIRTHLTSLQRLRLRMRNLCPDILTPLSSEILSHRRLPLRELIINLSLADESPVITSAGYTLRCGLSHGGILSLQEELLEQAQALAACAASPSVYRILRHSLPQFSLLSTDALTGRSMRLADDAKWEDDGEESEPEPGSEPESDIPSLASSF